MHSRTVVDLIVAVAAIGAAALAYEFGRGRRRDRAMIAGLRRALTPNDVPVLPGMSIASAVASASDGIDVGGDIADVFGLDSRFALLLVADVSGNGIAAAAHTAFIKYSIRTLALEGDGDPAVVLTKFNAMYGRTIKDLEAFVVLILGVIDSQTGELRYASAGHEPAFLRRANGHVALLAPTGPIVGVAPLSTYGTRSVMLGAGDMLVWATDGLTESRDRKRRLLGADGLAGWIARAPGDVGTVADWLIAALRRRSGRRVRDDVAVLAMTFDPAAAGVLAPPAAAYNGR